jgi:hypothetical protein
MSINVYVDKVNLNDFFNKLAALGLGDDVIVNGNDHQLYKDGPVVRMFTVVNVIKGAKSKFKSRKLFKDNRAAIHTVVGG